MDPQDNPELLAAEMSGELATPEIGGAEVQNAAIEAVRADIDELPKELRGAFNRIESGLGEAIYLRAEEVAGYLRSQLEGSDQQDSISSYGNIDNETSVGAGERKQLSFGEVEQIVTELKQLSTTLAEKVKGQQGDTKVIDLAELSGGESHATGMFWHVLTGNEVFEVGDTAEVAGFEVTASEGQGRAGIGAESPQIEISKEDSEDDEIEAGSVVAAEEAEEAGEQPMATVTALDPDRVHPRHEPDRRYPNEAKDVA